MTTARFLCFFLILFCGNALLFGQGYCYNGAVYLNETHSIAYADVAYASKPQIDEWDFPIQETVALRVYYPTDLAIGEVRPLVVLIHGGGFVGGSRSDVYWLAERLAKQGYITASLDYRLCKRVDCSFAAGTQYPCGVNWGTSAVPSVYAATTDVNDGIRWLQANASTYHIDPANVVVGGMSAGAFLAMNAAYLDQSEYQSICPSCGTWPDYVADSLGSLTGIKGVMSFAGAIMDTTWFDADEVSNVPFFAVHGTSDGVVTYCKDHMYPCCSDAFSPDIFGSCPITTRVRNLGGSYYLITADNYNHDVGQQPLGNFWLKQAENFLMSVTKCGVTNIKRHTLQTAPTPIPICTPPFAGDTCVNCNIPYTDTLVLTYDTLCATVLTPATVVTESATSINLIWQAKTNATKYQVQYRQIGSATWLSATTTRNYLNITGLTTGQTYEYHIRTFCPSGWTGYSNTWQFTVIAATTCDKPILGGTTPISPLTTRVMWNYRAGATKYSIRYRVTNSTAWTNKTSNSPIATSLIANLQPNTRYLYQIRSYCPTATNSYLWSGYSSVGAFITPPQVLALTSPTLIDAQQSISDEITLSPVPTSGDLHISFGQLALHHLTMFDLFGRQIMQVSAINFDGTLQCSNLPAGIYLLRIELADKTIVVKRFSKL